MWLRAKQAAPAASWPWLDGADIAVSSSRVETQDCKRLLFRFQSCYVASVDPLPQTAKASNSHFIHVPEMTF